MKKLSKKEKAIHDQFSKYGTNAKEWMRKCVLMLPQIEKNQIWKKKGFGSIYEYAAKIAGMSRYKVTDSLRIIRKIADKPALMEVAKAKGVNAVRPVAAIATKESSEFWAGKANEMSVNTLVVYAKDYELEHSIAGRSVEDSEKKSGDVTGSPTNNGSNKGKFFHKTDVDIKMDLCVDEKVQLSMKVDPEVVEALKKIKGVGNWNEAMKKLLKLSQGELEAVEKKQQEKESRLRAELETEKPEPVRSSSRKVPAAIEKFIKKRSGGKCEHPNCGKAGEHIHHIETFALRKIHDPDKMLHLCKEHHRIIHNGYIDDGKIQLGIVVNSEMSERADMAFEFEERRRKQWRQIEKLPSYDIKNLINVRVAEFQW